MKRSIFVKFSILSCIVALSCGVLAGCANAGSIAASEEQQANRAYMSQVNEIMDQLGVGLDSFVDAVSRGDVVNMRSQADNAYGSLDKLNGLEAPEDLADVRDGYLNGTSKLREALDSYIALYSDASTGAFDWSTYDARIAAVQSLYDEGIDALRKADEAAASKQ